MPWESNLGNVNLTQYFVTLPCSITEFLKQYSFFIMLLKLDQMVFRFWILHEQIIDIVYCFLNTGEDVYVVSKSNLIENSYFS